MCLSFLSILPPVSHSFPMVFLWFSYGFPMVIPPTSEEIYHDCTTTAMISPRFRSLGGVASLHLSPAWRGEKSPVFFWGKSQWNIINHPNIWNYASCVYRYSYIHIYIPYIYKITWWNYAIFQKIAWCVSNEYVSNSYASHCKIKQKSDSYAIFQIIAWLVVYLPIW